jgi:lysine-N-methylase
MTSHFRAKLVSEFVCITDKCPDTCCKHWSMQVDSVILEKYKNSAPELLAAVEQDNDGTFIMRKDKQTSYCVKFEGGKCGIQLKHGEEFLGDACYSYPRITRAAGGANIITATMSCPEITRLALYGENPFSIEEVSVSRVPNGIKNVVEDGLSFEDAMSIHKLFVTATEDKEASAEKIFARISSVSRSLSRIEKKGWLGAAGMYFRLADSSLPAPEKNINDPFNLLHSLCGLIVASQKSIPPRLQQTISEMENALRAKLDWQNVLINTSDESLAAYDNLQKLWQDEMRNDYAPLLKRWLGAQISAAFYPFAGLGANLTERITIIGVRLAIIKLALKSTYSVNSGKLHQDDVVRVVQSLSRLLDHLADPKFSLEIYNETGWIKENRLFGLLS